MTRAITFFIIMYLIAIGKDSIGQSISIKRQSIGSMGKSYSDSEISIQQAIGQSYYTKSYQNSLDGYFPGFIQPVSYNFVNTSNTNNISINVFPNPTSDRFYFDTNLKNVVVEVYSVNGDLVYTEFTSDILGYYIECSQWPSGTYFVYLKNGRTINYAKLIKN